MKIIIIILLSIFLSPPAWAKDEFDGNFWRGLGEGIESSGFEPEIGTMIVNSVRKAFIRGFWEGSNYTESICVNTAVYQYAKVFLADIRAKEAGEKQIETKSKEREMNIHRITEFSEILKEKKELRGITIDQIVDGLNIFYEDFKNRTILVSDAIYVVKKQIRGAPPEDIERILLYLRGGKKDSKHLRIEDEKGNPIRHIPFP